MGKWDVIGANAENSTVSNKWDVVNSQGSPLSKREYETGEISAITTKQILRSDPNAPGGASMSTYLKTGFVDDPETRIKIYAKDRFPGLSETERLSRYGVYDGEIVFLADDGNIYTETEKGPGGKIKKFAGESVARMPAAVMGGIGATAGPVPAVIGGAGGEGIRKTVANIAFDEPQTATGNIKNMALEGAIEGLSYGGAKLGNAMLNYAGKKQAGNLAKAAGRDIKTISIPRTTEATRQAAQYGIDLPTPAATQSRKLIDKYKLLRDLPRTANKINALDIKLDKQSQDAVWQFLREVSPDDVEMYSVGKEIVGASKGAIKDLVEARKKLAGPLYKEAFEEGTTVDIKPIIEMIDGELETAKGPVRAAYLRAKNLLMKPDLPKGGQGLYDQAGNIIDFGDVGYDTTLKGLHGSKIGLDELLDAAKNKKSSAGKTTTKIYRDVKDLLLDQMDNASSKYKEARAIFSSESDFIEELTKKRKITDLAKLEGDNIEKAIPRLFAGKSENAIKYIKPLIQKQNHEVWNRAVKTHLVDIFETSRKRAGVSGNWPANFWKYTVNDVKQNRMLKEALSPQQYKSLNDFAEIMRKVGTVYGKESATATRQESLKEMRRESGGIVRDAAKAARTLFNSVLENVDEVAFEKYQDELVFAFGSEDAAKQLMKLKQLNPKSEKFLTGLNTFMASVAAGVFSKEMKRENPTDRPIYKQQGQGRNQ